MRTPTEFEPIALWMGWEKDESGNLWVKEKTVARLVCKTSLTNSEAVEALDRLVEKGYAYSLHSHSDSTKSVQVGKFRAVTGGEETHVPKLLFNTEAYTTIHEAVEQALLQIAAEEG